MIASLYVAGVLVRVSLRHAPSVSSSDPMILRKARSRRPHLKSEINTMERWGVCPFNGLWGKL
jgi:hypothetical protein